MVPHHSATATAPGCDSERHPMVRPPLGSYCLRSATICSSAARDSGVSRLPEEHAGVVAQVDDAVAHHCYALLPLLALRVLFLVGGWRNLDDAEAIVRFTSSFCGVTCIQRM